MGWMTWQRGNARIKGEFFNAEGAEVLAEVEEEGRKVCICLSSVFFCVLCETLAPFAFGCFVFSAVKQKTMSP